jgi:hypothetical protein
MKWSLPLNYRLYRPFLGNIQFLGQETQMVLIRVIVGTVNSISNSRCYEPNRKKVLNPGFMLALDGKCY